MPVVSKRGDEYYFDESRAHSVGKIHSFYGAVLIAVRAYTYLRTLGPEGVREAGENALLNANYLRAKLGEKYDVAFPNEFCMHEVVLSASRQKQEHGVRAHRYSRFLLAQSSTLPAR